MRGCIALVCVMACGGDGKSGDDDDAPHDAAPLPAPACASAGGTATVAMPVLKYTLFDRYQEAWLASPAVADLDGDGTMEIVVPRSELLEVWHTDNTIAWKATLPGRIWASPVVADLVPSSPGLEVAVASRDTIAMYSATGAMMPGFPVTWRDEMRSLATADVDGDGRPDLVAVTSTPLSANNQKDVVIAIENTGAIIAGFPPNTTGAAGCDDACYVTGGYDQNIALGDIDGDHRADLFVTQDDAYMSLHDGTGKMFPSASIFTGRKTFGGIRWMVDYGLAQQGYANDEAVDEQAHFTNTAPAIADLDGDGVGDLISLGSIQNAAQTDRLRGVGLFVAHDDGTRLAEWLAPPRFPDYLSGLWDYGDNIVAITNQVAIGPGTSGPVIVFAGFDGKIHAVDAHAQALWATAYTTDAMTGTGGVAIADLSGDGVPEIVLTSYGVNGGDLIILDAAGNLLSRTPLGGRGAMPVPTIADVDGDGVLDIVVSLKDAVDKQQSVLVFAVPGSSANCLAWPTGRGSYRRDGYVPPK